MATIIGAAVYPGDCDVLHLAQARTMKIMDNADIARMLYTALKLSQDRCQMKGGARWHLQAQREVATKCSRCVAIDAYEELHNIQPRTNG